MRYQPKLLCWPIYSKFEIISKDKCDNQSERKTSLNAPFKMSPGEQVPLSAFWRKREDSNLRDIAAHTISSRAPSTTRPRFHY